MRHSVRVRPPEALPPDHVPLRPLRPLSSFLPPWLRRLIRGR